MRLLFILLWLTTLALANPTSFDDEFEAQRLPQGSQLAPPVAGDAEKTMQLVQELYDIAGPKIGSRFVEPVYLLVLGDQRPYGSWNGFMLEPGPEDDATIEKLNAYLLPRGYSIHPKKANDSGRVPAFSLRSLAGLQKRTEESRLRWVPRYDRASGWPGYYAWKSAIYKALPSEQQDISFDLVEGIMLGYPDPAVENFRELAWDNWPSTVEAFIPSAYTYLNGVPIFELRAEDADHQAVTAKEEQWEQFLTACYQSTDHKELAKRPDFLHWRTKLHSQGRQKTLFSGDARYGEARRLGFTERGPSALPLNSAHERWMKGNLSEILQALRSTPDLVEVAKLGCDVELSSRHLWSWLLRGSFEPNSEAGQLFEVFNQLYPTAYANLYRRELDSRTRPVVERGPSDSPQREGRPLADMLNSSYLRGQLASFPEAEQIQAFQAVQACQAYPPLGKLVTEAQHGRGPYAALLQQLRRSHPELWRTPVSLRARARCRASCASTTPEPWLLASTPARGSAVLMKISLTWPGVRFGLAERMVAITPAMIGVAIEVPEMVI